MNWRGTGVIVLSLSAVLIAFIYGCVVAGYMTTVWSNKVAPHDRQNELAAMMGGLVGGVVCAEATLFFAVWVHRASKKTQDNGSLDNVLRSSSFGGSSINTRQQAATRYQVCSEDGTPDRRIHWWGLLKVTELPGKQAIVTCCKLVMIFCLSLEGLFLAAAGFPYYEHMLPFTLVLGIAWVLTVISCLFYSKRPILVMVWGGVILAVNSLQLRRSEPTPHALDWILLHLPELLFLVAACIGAFINWMTRGLGDGRNLP
jgi:hypothetical protein